MNRSKPLMRLRSPEWLARRVPSYYKPKLLRPSKAVRNEELQIKWSWLCGNDLNERATCFGGVPQLFYASCYRWVISRTSLKGYLYFNADHTLIEMIFLLKVYKNILVNILKSHCYLHNLWLTLWLGFFLKQWKKASVFSVPLMPIRSERRNLIS